MKMEIKAPGAPMDELGRAYLYETEDRTKLLYLRTPSGWIYIQPGGSIYNSEFSDIDLANSRWTKRVPPGTVVTLTF